jgi:hypothetical protein
MNRRPFVFLTDVDPGPWRFRDLCGPALRIAKDQSPGPRIWFIAANSLGLALAKLGFGREAAELMQMAIDFANDLSARKADWIELGVESWINRVDLLRTEDPESGEEMLRACYDLVRARPVSRRKMFGLEVARLNDAGSSVKRRAIGILRNRSQSSLLKHLIKRGEDERARAFAGEVVTDFPDAVLAGMLHAVEVLATYEPSHPFLSVFNLRQPRTEGDFIVWLRTLVAGPSGGCRSRLSSVDLEGALADWAGRPELRNPRTPLLWALYAGVVSGAEAAVVADLVDTAVRACVEASDQRLYRVAGSLVDPVCLADLPSFADDVPEIDPRSLVSPLMDTAARVARSHAAL